MRPKTFAEAKFEAKPIFEASAKFGAKPILRPGKLWDQAKGARPGFRVCRSFMGLANVPSNQIPYYGELRFCNIGRFVSHHHDVGYGISRGLSNGYLAIIPQQDYKRWDVCVYMLHVLHVLATLKEQKRTLKWYY